MKTYELELFFEIAPIYLDNVGFMPSIITQIQLEDVDDLYDIKTLKTKINGDIILINTSNVLYTRIKEIKPKNNTIKI